MIDINNIDWEKFQLAKSGRIVKLLYNKEPLQFCSSYLYTPFGVKSVTKDWANFTEFFVSCSLNDASSETAINFKDFISKLDNKISDLVKENSGIFNNAKVTQDASKCEYSPILKENGDYPKLMKLQFVRDKNGNFISFVFDENKEKVKIDESNIETILSKGKVFKCIIECSKIWCYNGKVGSVWNILQLRFAKNNEKTNTQNGNNYSSLMIQDD